VGMPVYDAQQVDEVLDKLVAKKDAWRDLAQARGELLTCYRLNKHPSEKLLDRLEKAWESLRQLGEVAPT